jgi:hypothetical protein
VPPGATSVTYAKQNTPFGVCDEKEGVQWSGLCFKPSFPVKEAKYEGESKIIRNVATYCAVGYTAGWA